MGGTAMKTKVNIKKLTMIARVFVIIMFLLLIAPRLGSVSAESIAGNTFPLPIALLVFLVIYAVKPVVMLLPVNVLYLAAGVLFSPVVAVVATYIGLALMLSVGYLNGRELGEAKVSDILAKHQKAASFLDSRRNITSMCFLVRLFPMPKDLFSMFFGAVGMPFYKYLAVSLAGMSPVMLSSVIAAYIATAR